MSNFDLIETLRSDILTRINDLRITINQQLDGIHDELERQLATIESEIEYEEDGGRE